MMGTQINSCQMGWCLVGPENIAQLINAYYSEFKLSSQESDACLGIIVRCEIAHAAELNAKTHNINKKVLANSNKFSCYGQTEA